jgi:hypothetical protein
MEVKLEILKHFKKGSKTKTSLLIILPDERVLNKHLIMWILVEAKLSLKGLPGLIIENSQRNENAVHRLGALRMK